MPRHFLDKYLTEEEKMILDRSGYGSLSGFGERPALLVIDTNYAFCGEKSEPVIDAIKHWSTSCGKNAWDAIPIIQRLIFASRAKGIPVIYSTGTGRPDGWDRGSWAWKKSLKTKNGSTAHSGRNGNDIVAEIAPNPSDIIIRKLKPSAFHETPLGSFLTLLKADSVLVTGGTTSGCVRATVIDAFSRNLRVTVVEDGCFDRFHCSHAVNLFDMHAKYADVIKSADVVSYIESLPGGLFALPLG